MKGRRKPTVIAYVLNQLARRYADDDLREAIARQRSVVGQLTAKTATLMKSRSDRSPRVLTTACAKKAPA